MPTSTLIRALHRVESAVGVDGKLVRSRRPHFKAMHACVSPGGLVNVPALTYQSAQALSLASSATGKSLSKTCNCIEPPPMRLPVRTLVQLPAGMLIDVFCHSLRSSSGHLGTTVRIS